MNSAAKNRPQATIISRCSKSIQSNSIQSNSIRFNPIQSNPIQSNPIQSNPIHPSPRLNQINQQTRNDDPFAPSSRNLSLRRVGDAGTRGHIGCAGRSSVPSFPGLCGAGATLRAVIASKQTTRSLSLSLGRALDTAGLASCLVV
jgi:hypothetical protein